MNSSTHRVEASPRAGVVMAVLMPHAPVLVPGLAGERSAQVATTVRAMREAARRVVEARPDSLVAVSPHSPRKPGAFGLWTGHRLHGSLAAFGAPEAAVTLPIDSELSSAIATEAKSRGLAIWSITGESLDHGAVVPLWFLAEAGWRGPTALFGLNDPEEGGGRELGEAIAAAAARMNRRLAFLGSGDMSHRLTPGAPCGFHPRAAAFDRGFIELIERGGYGELSRIDPELQQLAAEDVVDSTRIAAAATNGETAGHQVLSYEGPFGVGYGVAILFARG